MPSKPAILQAADRLDIGSEREGSVLPRLVPDHKATRGAISSTVGHFPAFSAPSAVHLDPHLPEGSESSETGHPSHVPSVPGTSSSTTQQPARTSPQATRVVSRTLPSVTKTVSRESASRHARRRLKLAPTTARSESRHSLVPNPMPRSSAAQAVRGQRRRPVFFAPTLEGLQAEGPITHGEEPTHLPSTTQPVRTVGDFSGSANQPRQKAVSHIVSASRRAEGSPVVGTTAEATVSPSRIAALVESLVKSERRASRGPVSYARTLSAPRARPVFIEATVEESQSESTEPGTHAAQPGKTGPAKTQGRPLDWLTSRAPITAEVIRKVIAEGRVLHLGPQGLPTSQATTRTTLPAEWAATRQESPKVNLSTTAHAQDRRTAITKMVDGRFTAGVRTSRSEPRPAHIASPSFTLPHGQEGEADASNVAQAAQAVGSAHEQVSSPWRTGLSTTLGAVDAGIATADMPTWAQRANGEPLKRSSSSDFIGALAQASAPEDVVRVLFERGQGMSLGSASALPKPVIQVIEQIQTEARTAEAQEASTHVPAQDPTRTEQLGSQRRRRLPPRSTARVSRSMTGLKPDAMKGLQLKEDKIMKLAKRLQDLIHLSQRHKEGARAEVRMAEDSSAARTEGQQAPTQSESGDDLSQVDVEALSSHVLQYVTRELDLRRERRQEESDERDFWW